MSEENSVLGEGRAQQRMVGRRGGHERAGSLTCRICDPPAAGERFYTPAVSAQPCPEASSQNNLSAPLPFDHGSRLVAKLATKLTRTAPALVQMPLTCMHHTQAHLHSVLLFDSAC
eukprot:1160475-Pelagomonas_calceolata.AAC.5